MAKIKAFKFVSTGALQSSSFATVRASVAPIKALNSVGKSVEGIGNVVGDVVSINKGILGAFAKIAENQKKQLRLQRDAAAEQRQEKAALKVKSTQKAVGRKNKKKVKKGFIDGLIDRILGGLLPFAGPMSAWFTMLAGVLAAKGAFDLLTDEEKRE